MTSLTDTGPHPVDAPGVPVFDHVNFLCRTLLSGDATGGAFSVVEERGRLGCMSPRHLHEREAETFVVLDGALEGWCARADAAGRSGKPHLPARGTGARVPSHVVNLPLYTIISPAGFESFFAATGTAVEQPFHGNLPQPGPLTPQAIEALQRVLTPLGCTVTGPPPSSTSPPT